ncbi:transporter [Gilvimarinus sp. SDUM040013]|uniref:Transporter n=1 Tax=Gilvimarinus gilvus TaxID=3058038 RepID=A0ABU4S5X4_9GAMM|nr:transporter [Gilvimarinus sp. SDUM040013]MDO3385436.1 transporter [Gilvimarinus sp. SDUM040013]MDX6851303.1 transporter [Gilvimarinus sp. SDUM040013]
MRFNFTYSLFILLTSMLVFGVQAQELAPRAYWPAPNGTNAAVMSYQHSAGDVLVDASAPIEGAEVTLDFLSLTYQRTFNLFERTGNLQINYPLVQGHAEAIVNGEFAEHSISASADPRVRMAINLMGAPSMDREQFRNLAANPGPIVGASVLVSIPTGEYDGNRLFNAGTNRWAVKPALGFILPLSDRWLFEGELGAWLYEDNDNYLGKTRSQKPLLSSEVHLVHVIKSGTWVSFDLNWYQGGAATVGDGPEQAELQNSRAGITFLQPIKRRHAIRAALSTGIESKIAGDFDSITLSYMYIW